MKRIQNCHKELLSTSWKLKTGVASSPYVKLVMVFKCFTQPAVYQFMKYYTLSSLDSSRIFLYLVDNILYTAQSQTIHTGNLKSLLMPKQDL